MKGSKFFLISLLCLLVHVSGALDFQMPKVVDIVGFGTILMDQTYGMVPRSDMLLESEDNGVEVPSSGTIIYTQPDAPMPSVFSFPLGGTVAILHPDNYVTLLAGLEVPQKKESSELGYLKDSDSLIVKKGEILANGNGSGVFPAKFYSLRLFDVRNLLWINPIIFASWIQDRTAPTIRGVTLARPVETGKARFSLSMGNSKGKKLACAQGSYDIYVNAVDTIIPGTNTYSAPYRVIVALDGKSVIDTSFMAAHCSEEGLAFLGDIAPSRKTVDGEGSYDIGSLMLARGEHDLQLQVSDYAGNRSTLEALVSVY